MNKNFFDIMKEALFINNFTQKELAERIHITPQTLNSYLNGRSRIHLDDFCEIARILHIDPNYVLGFSKLIDGINDAYLLRSYTELTIEQKNSIIALLKHYDRVNEHTIASQQKSNRR